MPDELEQRLERTLQAMPPPGADATERALRSALDALPPPLDARRRRRRRLLVPAAACAVAFVFGGVTLAATGGRLPLVGTSQHHPRTQAGPSPAAHHPVDVLPRGAISFSAAAGGRAWLATSSGASLHGRPLSALAVSPGAVNAVEAGGHGLRAVTLPQGRVAFSQAVGGTAVAAVWAPAAIRIAYVVRDHGRYRVYDMWGNGSNRFLVAHRATAAAPSWRWDSQAFAYIRGDGSVMVHSVISGATSALRPGCGQARPAAVAFAPFGGLLAIADRAGRVRVIDTLHHGPGLCLQGAPSGEPKIAWLRPRQFLVGAGDTITRYVVRGSAGGVDVTDVPGQVAGIVVAPGGHRIALALRDPSGAVRVVEAGTPRFSEAALPLRVGRLLLELGRVAGPVTLAWQ